MNSTSHASEMIGEPKRPSTQTQQSDKPPGLVRRVWRILLAVKDGLALLALLIFFVCLWFLLSGGPNPADTRGGALLVELSGVLVEQTEEADPLGLIQGDVPSFAQYRASDVVRALKQAATDSDIKAVVLNLDGFMGGGQVSLQDVARALDAVKAAKKPVLTYATGYTDDGYLLAAHASEVFLNPMGAVLLSGPGGNSPYFKGLADRFGVNVHVYRVGKYKSFVEPYTRAGMSDEARASSQELVDALWEDWQANVKAARPAANIAPLLKDPAAAAGGKDFAVLAKELKIVDTLGDETAFGRRIAQIVGSDEDEAPGDFNRSTLENYLSANPAKQSGDGVGIVTIAGEIVDGEASGGTAGGATVERLIHSALTDDDIKALVVRIDSPGGSALASERMRLAMANVRAAKKPVIVSMANVAASGGYWAAMGGDKVYAEPATITGSIGVFGIIPTFENTLSRYGVTSDGVRATPLSGQPDVIAGTSPEVDAAFQAGVEDIYRRFTSLVSTSRKLPVARVDEIAQGRVWAGGSARQLQLVDAFGSLDDAVAEAAKRASLDPSSVRRIELEEGQSFLSWVLGSVGIKAPVAISPDAMSLHAARQRAQFSAGIRDGLKIMSGPSVQLRCMTCPAAPARTTANLPSISLLTRMFP